MSRILPEAHHEQLTHTDIGPNSKLYPQHCPETHLKQIGIKPTQPQASLSSFIALRRVIRYHLPEPQCKSMQWSRVRG